jgi:hypothetical protein
VFDTYMVSEDIVTTYLRGMGCAVRSKSDAYSVGAALREKVADGCNILRGQRNGIQIFSTSVPAHPQVLGNVTGRHTENRMIGRGC